jgi:hypothetical protein
VYEESMRVNGNAQQTMDLRNLPDGIYILRIEGDGFSIVKKIVQNR